MFKCPVSRLGQLDADPGGLGVGQGAGQENWDPPPSPGRGPGHGGIGEAVLYSGDELHRWEPLGRGLSEASGERVLLVVWARSSAWRREYRYCDDETPVRDSSYLYM